MERLLDLPPLASFLSLQLLFQLVIQLKILTNLLEMLLPGHASHTRNRSMPCVSVLSSLSIARSKQDAEVKAGPNSWGHLTERVHAVQARKRARFHRHTCPASWPRKRTTRIFGRLRQRHEGKWDKESLRPQTYACHHFFFQRERNSAARRGMATDYGPAGYQYLYKYYCTSSRVGLFRFASVQVLFCFFNLI